MNERFLRIEKYGKYQHYKDRDPAWVKQHRGFWTDYDMAVQKTSTRLFALFLISYASEFGNQLVPYNISELSRRSSLNRVAVETGIEKLCEASFIAIVSHDSARKNLDKSYTDASALDRDKSKEVSTNVLTGKPPKKERKKDELWDALVQVIGSSPQTTNERGKWNAALKQLREANATPSEIVARSLAFRKRWPGMTLTPTALCSHWGALASSPSGPSQESRRAQRYEHLHEESA